MVHVGLLQALIIGGVGGVCNQLCGCVQAVIVGRMADLILVSVPVPLNWDGLGWGWA